MRDTMLRCPDCLNTKSPGGMRCPTCQEAWDKFAAAAISTGRALTTTDCARDADAMMVERRKSMERAT